jgi:hypothetical protein
LKYISELLATNPLDHFARFEKYLNTGEKRDKDEFTGLIRQELPHETYIEMAIQYVQWNLAEEALRILELAPEHPMVQVWQAYLLDKKGEKAEAGRKLDKAMAASPELVFPFRPEMTGIFSWADQQKPGWIWKYYEALIRWQCNQPEEAKALFTGCGTEPDFVPFYLAKAELFQDDKRIEEAALNRAYGLDPSNWRTGIRLARFCANNDQKEKATVCPDAETERHVCRSLVRIEPHENAAGRGGCGCPFPVQGNKYPVCAGTSENTKMEKGPSVSAKC